MRYTPKMADATMNLPMAIMTGDAPSEMAMSTMTNEFPQMSMVAASIR